MTYTEAYDALPKDAKWSSSFGYPGQGGFTEYWRQPDGTQWIVKNGPWNGPEVWTVEKKGQ